MIAVATPGGVMFRDFETADQRKVADVTAEAKAWAEARKPRCPTAQLINDLRATVAEAEATVAATKGGRDGQG